MFEKSKSMLLIAAGATVKTTTADALGTYSVSGLAAGGYVVQASYQGFAQFISPTIQLAAGQSKRVDISMAVRRPSPEP